MKPTEHKIALRREMREVRARIAAEDGEREERSAVIWQRVIAELEHRRGRMAGGEAARGGAGASYGVMLFESLPSEPDTARWIDDVRRRGWRAFVPEVDGPRLRVGPGDIDPADLDVVVVPGVGFTADGARLGQGGGHYDRFLPRLRPDCLTIGVCFREQLVDELPLEPHDVQLDLVISA